MSSSKKIYLLRHAEKDPNGTLTSNGKTKAKELGQGLPKFDIVICSDSSRSRETAELMSGVTPKTDPRCGFYMAPKVKSDLLNKIASDKNISFLSAVKELNDPEVNNGIDKKADDLIALINETISNLSNGQTALIISHDLSISPAMSKYNIPLESIDYLSGYIIDGDWHIEKFNAQFFIN